MRFRVGLDRSQFGIGLHWSGAKDRFTLMLTWLFVSLEFNP
jgi:hypothetical protein